MRTRTLAFALLPAAFALAALAGDHFPYVYAPSDNNQTISGGNINEIVRIAKKFRAPYIWFRLDGQEYLVRDAVTLDEARNAFADLRAMEPEEHEIEMRLRPYEKKMDAIEERMDPISDQLGDDEDLSESERESLEKQLEGMEREQEVVERAMESIQRDQERVEREMERREKIAERKFAEILRRAVEQGRAGKLN